jgi:hypothetical protein
VLGRQSDIFRCEYPGPLFWTPPILTVPIDNKFGQCTLVAIRLLRRFERRHQREGANEHVDHALGNIPAMPNPPQPRGQGGRSVLACASRHVGPDRAPAQS